MTVPTPPAAPRPLGRLATRILLAGLLLSLVATVLLFVQGNDASLTALVVMAGFGLLLVGLPSVLFLLHSRRQPPPLVPRDARIAVWFSAITLVLFGLLLVAMGGEVDSLTDQVIGVAIGVTGIVTIVRVVRFAAPASGDTRLVYGRSSVVGAVFFLFVTVMIPKFACGCGERPKTALLKADLRNLVDAQDAFFADAHHYGSLSELEKANAFVPTIGDSLIVVGDAEGWHGYAVHMEIPDFACTIWSGGTRPAGPYGARAREPRCGSP
jgi:uncharacterized membrane protein HdeD (DUF308 family)